MQKFKKTDKMKAKKHLHACKQRQKAAETAFTFKMAYSTDSGGCGQGLRFAFIYN